jgi:large subunit ribosomal protein L15
MATKKTEAESSEQTTARKAPAVKAPAAAKPAAAKAEKPAAAKAKPATAKADKPAAAKAEKPAAAKADKPAAAKAEKPAAAKADKPVAAKAAAKTSSATADKPKATSTPAKKVAPEGLGGTLRLHHLRPAPGAHKPKTRVGRGEGSKGKTAGRGTKGTKARYQVPESREGGGIPLHMRIPKLRGFKNPFKTTYQVVNLERLESLYPKGGTVTAEDLATKGAVRKGEPVKVLGNGDLSVKLDVAVAVSASAKEKILAAGGSVRD